MRLNKSYIKLYKDIAGKCLQHFVPDIVKAIESIQVQKFVYAMDGSYVGNHKLIIVYSFYSNMFRMDNNINGIHIDIKYFRDKWIQDQVINFYNGRAAIYGISVNQILYSNYGKTMDFKTWFMNLLDQKMIKDLIEPMIQTCGKRMLDEAREWEKRNPEELKKALIQWAASDIMAILDRYPTVTTSDIRDIMDRQDIERVIES